MTDELSLQEEMLLDEACERFEAAYRAGDSPKIGDYLEEAPDSIREVLAKELGAMLAELEAPPAESGVPDSIGRYRIVRRIGEGGMGTVYEAIQDEPERRVAVKVVRPDLSSPRMTRRFRREVGVLGHLHHPGIAQIFDAGTAAVHGRETPYLVMEYVEGMALGEYAKAHDLSIPQRVALVRQVCSAIQHAHDQGVVHRDLKPANVLVRPGQSASGTDLHEGIGRPVVLDFGVARATQEVAPATLETQVGQVVGTLSHMAPEQIDGDSTNIDGRADVYALGVVLYELLTGHLPIDLQGANLTQAAERIRGDVPPLLRTHDSRLAGDLEIVVGKALSKEPEGRYPTAAAFGEDLMRFLEEEPIRARRPSALYHLRLFARRNRMLVTGLSAAAALIVVALIVVSVLLVQQSSLRKTAIEERNEASMQRAIAIEERKKASEQREIAIDERDKAKAVASFQRELLNQGNLEDGGNPRETTLLQALNWASDAVATAFPGAPTIEGAIRLTLANSYLPLQEYEKAEEHLLWAIETFEREYGDVHPDLARAMHLYSRLLEADGRYEEAGPAYERALALALQVYGPDTEEVDSCRNNLATYYDVMGDYKRAEKIHREVLANRIQREGERSGHVANTLNNLATVIELDGRYEEAESMYRRALSIRREIYEPPHLRLGNSINNLGAVLIRQGKLEEAEELTLEALAMREQLLGPNHPDVGHALNNLGALKHYQGKFDESIELFRRSLHIQELERGKGHPSTRTMRFNLAHQLRRQGRWEEAHEITVVAVQLLADSLGPGHIETLKAETLLASIENGLGRVEEALERAQSVVDRIRETGEFQRELADSMGTLGDLLVKAERYEEATPVYDQVIELDNQLDPRSPSALNRRMLHADLVGHRGDLKEAARLADKVHADHLEILGEDHVYTGRAANLVAELKEKLNAEESR